MIKNSQRGIALYLVIVMLSVLLAIVLGLASIIIGGANVAESLGHSVIAFHAADTGMEKALYNIKLTSGTCDDSTSDGSFGDSYTYDVTMSTTGSDCSDAGTTITSSGLYITAKRKIEVSY